MSPAVVKSDVALAEPVHADLADAGDLASADEADSALVEEIHAALVGGADLALAEQVHAGGSF